MVAMNLIFVIHCFVLIGATVGSTEDPKETAEDQVSTPDVTSDQSDDHLSTVEKVLQEFEQSILENEISLNGSSDVDVTATSGGESGGGGAAVGTADGGKTKQRQQQQRPRVNCIQLLKKTETDKSGEEKADELDDLILINGTELQSRMAEETNSNVTNRTAPATCSIILFYGNWCQFSARAAPSFNALPRFFPSLNFYAIEVANNLNIFSQYAVVALPSVLVFHNGKPVYGFNNSMHNLETYVQFVSNITGAKPDQNFEIELLEQDYEGPVPNTVVEKLNYNLVLAYLFILLCLLVNISKSTYVTNLTDTLRNLWREVEIQHEHAD
eukprot:TRINITY_DN2839_c0_g1_i1.p1 TRINITY_DN2839_c0_g1~~TRINITY_DN2839_c0_g1_i1.p1  ORF type:complete len:327 (-),score=88.78 TRINITY_DN2839_c0_g1_i1:281-1261(-)